MKKNLFTMEIVFHLVGMELLIGVEQETLFLLITII